MRKFKVIDLELHVHIIDAYYMNIESNGVLCFYAEPFSSRPIASFQTWISAVSIGE